MKITSPIFVQEGKIPKIYTCEGEDFNPPLLIENAPDKTKSMALIVHDPDAPSGDFVHWVVWNIPPSVKEIKERQSPRDANEGLNDTGKKGYKGPCPPSGTHRYNFHFYALDNMLDIPETSNKTDLRNEMKGHILEEASLIGLYKKVNGRDF